MHRLILQGSSLTAETTRELAEQLNAEPDFKSGFALLSTETAIDAEHIQALRQRYDFDINRLPEGFDPRQVRLVISDMDSTLISIECVDEIADFAGVKPQVAEITEAAMRGELDFAQSLRKRVRLLTGLHADKLQQVYAERLELNPGAETLLGTLKKNGVKFALVSGGFTFFTERLKRRLALDFTLANDLDIDSHNLLTGKIQGEIVGAEAKADFLRQLCAELDIRPEQTVAIGDGANDLKMMAIAGLGVAYHAKPKVQAQADCALNHCGLEGLLGILGQEFEGMGD